MTDFKDPYIEKFVYLKDDLNEWGKYVDTEIYQIIKNFKEPITLSIPHKYRLKDDQSFRIKIDRKNYGDPFLEMEDKVGTRVVLLTTKDVDSLAEKILTHTSWIAKITKSKDEVTTDIPDKFNYQSIHIVVEPLSSYSVIKKDINKSHLTCEIQIRTLLQHAYAEISHDNVYKGPYKNDPKILRNLAKSMALMEAADDYFCDIYDKIRNPNNMESNVLKYLTSKLNEIRNGDIDTPDIDLSDIVLSGLSDAKSNIIEAIDNWLNKDDVLRSNITNNNSYLNKQPIFLLLCYYASKMPNTLAKLDLNKESLKYIFNTCGVSYETYLY